MVGTAHIRAVDATWPEVGSQIHHSVGPWPLVLHDATTVREFSPGRHLILRAGFWPAGEAEVEFTVEPVADGVRLRMAETVLGGPMRWLGPVAAAGLRVRNGETLSRLKARVESRPHPV